MSFFVPERLLELRESFGEEGAGGGCDVRVVAGRDDGGAPRSAAATPEARGGDRRESTLPVLKERDARSR
jgi:hypothetical protein